MGRKFKAEKGSVGVCNGGFQNRGRGDLRAESEFFKGGRRKKVGILKGTGYDLGCTSFPPNNSISFEIGDETKLEFVILMKPTTPNYRCQS
ncbi:hypothetical protein Csa_005077 [Cucumis sativus]|uniref:Uncharacterized protein n=1 Tax=Cucumis sativus TaxID=3659 RepID=A0A0A0KBI0_CUCSA|nr:hypothetical protein Csa_005077 [Cucumis sativus]